MKETDSLLPATKVELPDAYKIPRSPRSIPLRFHSMPAS
jgi:hypothetical protein